MDMSPPASKHNDNAPPSPGLKSGLLTALGPLVAGILLVLLLLADVALPMALTAAIALWCVLWWIIEAVPIAATACLPLALFPLFGVLDMKQVGQAYGSPLVLLMLGGFMLSAAMAKSGAHRRIALGMVRLFGGGSERRIVYGFMAAATLLSMWISNTATALMLLPVALAVIDQARSKTLAAPLMLAVAYGSSIGGMGTPVGTPPNLIFMQAYRAATGQEISFLQWMAFAVPVVAVLAPLAAWWLARNLHQKAEFALPPVGHWRAEEKRVLAVFAITALLWVTRTAPFGGWRDWLALPTADDASIALLAVVALFVVRSGKRDADGRGTALLDWDTAARVPWDVLLLFGGGICLAEAFTATGLGAAIGGVLAGMTVLPMLLLMVCITLGVCFLSEAASNTALATLLMPVLAAAAISAGVEPALLMLPAVLAASCGFMLPVATPANAIVYGSGFISSQQMARTGFVLDVACSLVVAAFCYFYFAF